MRLRSLEVEAFRRFGHPVRLDGLTDGVNLLCEPNEAGKSTLLAAIRAVLFERHAANTESVRSLQHHRDKTSPVVRMAFELADGLHRVEKRFLHREPYARLDLPCGTRLEGSAAEERLQALLGFQQAGKRGASAESLGVWDVLLVGQQGAAEQPALSETGRATLHACLEAELGALTGSDRGGAVLRLVQAELGALLDGRGKPRGRYAEVTDGVAEAEGELRRLRDRRTALESLVADLARLRRDLAGASDAAAAARDAGDLADARRRREAALRHADKLAAARSDLRLAQQGRDAAAEEMRCRADRLEAIAAAGAQLVAAGAKRAKADEDLRVADGAVRTAQEASRAAEVAYATASRRVRSAHAAAALALRFRQAADLATRLAAADEAEAEVHRLTGELAAMPADEEGLQAVRKAQRAVDAARSVLDAQATLIELDLHPGAGGRVRIAGAAAPAGRTVLRAAADTEIAIAGIGTVRVRPAIRDRASLEGTLARAEAGLREALAVVGAADAQEAEAKGAARRGVELSLRGAEAALKAQAPGDPALGMAPGIAALRDTLAVLRRRLEAETAALGLDAVPGAEAEQALAAATAGEEAANEALHAARTALAGPEAAHGRATKAQADAAAKERDAEGALARLRQEQDLSVAGENDAALAGRLAAAEQALGAKRDAVAALERDAPTDTAEAMEARILRLEKSAAQRTEEAHRLRKEIAVHEERLAREEGEGIDEQLAAAERRHVDLTAEHASLRREADVLTLLRDTLAAAEREARERYVAPVLRRLQPSLQGLFPGVEVACDEGLRVTALTRRAGAEALEQLSDGTREQVAVLLRLAYAELLLDQGRPAMLVLDDALAYSDRDRLEAVFDLLTRAAQRLQVLVLTCRGDVFGRLGGTRVRLVPV